MVFSICCCCCFCEVYSILKTFKAVVKHKIALPCMSFFWLENSLKNKSIVLLNPLKVFVILDGHLESSANNNAFYFVSIVSHFYSV